MIIAFLAAGAPSAAARARPQLLHCSRSASVGRSACFRGRSVGRQTGMRARTRPLREGASFPTSNPKTRLALLVSSQPGQTHLGPAGAAGTTSAYHISTVLLVVLLLLRLLGVLLVLVLLVVSLVLVLPRPRARLTRRRPSRRARRTNMLCRAWREHARRYP